VSAAFLLTSLLVVATPGTGVLLTVAAGLAHGPRASLVTAVGCTLGIVPHLAAAVTGAAALLHAGGVLFEVVKVLGIAYLLFMAWSTWRDGGSFAPGTEAPARSDARIIVSAVLANLLNPKLTLFFFAFLPQFVPATDPHAVSKLLALSGVFMAMTFVVFAVYGLCAGGVRRHLLARPRIVVWMRRTFAAAFVGLSAKLAVTESS
jgi:threonine/homoserine/homoserine lactone efflux protein